MSFQAPTTTSLDISWGVPNSETSISNYTITITGEFGSRIFNSITDNTYNINGLQSGTQYSISVRAYDIYEFSSELATGSCSTLAEAPTNVVSSYIYLNSPYYDSATDYAEGIIIGGSSVSSSKMIVSFTAPSGNGITGYNVYDAATNVLVATDSSTNILVTGLTKGNSYQFYVKAITKNSANEDQFSAASASSAARVAATGPANMGQVSVGNVTSTSATLSWQPVNGNGLTTYYKIDLITGQMPSLIITPIVSSQTNTSYNLTSLSSDTVYYYMVTPFTDAGNGAGAGVTLTTLEAPPPPSGGGGESNPAICFLGDAPILTPRGYRRADSLCVGDKVRTADGRSVAVQRVFTKTYQPSATVNPYVIPAGQYGATEDVMVSPEHRVAVSGTGLIEARKLGLKQHKMTDEFTYYNLELPNWQTDNLVIGGVEVESLAPVRRLEITKGEFLTLLKAKYGKLTSDVISRACRTCFMTESGKVNIPVFAPSVKK